MFVFGGTEIYRLFFPHVYRMYITRIFHTFEVHARENPTYFPPFDGSEWEEISMQKGPKSVNNPYNYAFYVYERRK